MKEVTGDIWDYWLDMYLVAIPVNGFVRRDGRAVMGKGPAKQAKERMPNIDLVLGKYIKRSGWSNVYQIAPGIVSFPVKRDGAVFDGRNAVRHMKGKYTIGDYVPGWALKAETAIIENSLKMLQKFYENSYPYMSEYIVIPRVGCGAGELDWETDVKPLCEKYGDWLWVTSLV